MPWLLPRTYDAAATYAKARVKLKSEGSGGSKWRPEAKAKNKTPRLRVVKSGGKQFPRQRQLRIKSTGKRGRGSKIK